MKRLNLEGMTMDDLELTDDERALIEARRTQIDTTGVDPWEPVPEPEHVPHVPDHPQGGEKLHPDSYGDTVDTAPDA